MYSQTQFRKTSKKLYVAAIIISIIGIIITLFLYWYDASINKIKTSEDKGSVITESDIGNNHAEPGDGYSGETIYNGDPYIYKGLFEKPFERTDSYISNKNLILQEMNTKDELTMIAKRAESIVESMYTATAKDVNGMNSLTTELSNMFATSIILTGQDQEVYGNVEAAERFNEWYADTNTTMEAEMITDKCLVYMDEHSYIVRGLLRYTVYESEDTNALAEMLGMNLIKKGETYYQIVEVNLIPDECYYEDYANYKISELKMLN